MRTAIRLLVLLTAGVVMAQAGNPARRVISAASLPATCVSSVIVKDVYWQNSNSQLYVCTATNTWTASGGVVPTLPLSVANGGTGQTTYTKGDMLAAPGGASLNKLGVGTDGQVFTADAASTNGVKWAAAAGGGANTALSNLAAVAINLPLTTGAGTVAALTTTAAAQTASTTAGVGLTVTADNAVAGSTNAGAAAGGAVTITSGNAAQKTSGNANGGAITLTAGSGVGTGVIGVVSTNGQFSLTTGGTIAIPNLKFLSNGSHVDGIWNSAAGDVIVIETNDTNQLAVGPSGSVKAQSGGVYGFTSSTTDATASSDTATSRVAAGIVGASDGTGASNNRWFEDSGVARASADVTESAATLTNAITVSNLLAGKNYEGEFVVKCNNSQSAEGIQFDFNGGTATMTDFWAAGNQFAGGTDVTGTLISTSLAGVINFTTITGETVIVFRIAFKVNAAGTMILRFAENSHTTGTATVEKNSHAILRIVP